MIRALIIEDEEVLAVGLKDLLLGLRDDIQVVSIASGVKDAKEAIRVNPDLDIIFSDIRLGDGYCFEVFDSAKTDAYIVFTTAYDEYALKAFDYNSIDYILKPIDPKSLDDALRRFERNELRTRKADVRRLSEIGSHCLEISCGDLSRFVRPEDISHVVYEHGGNTVFCADGERGYAPGSLSALSESAGQGGQLVRVNRTTLVNRNAVAGFRKTLSRKKLLVLKAPYQAVRIETSGAVVKELLG